MKFFDSQPDDKLVYLLKQSRLDFKLDQKTTKARLLCAIAQGDIDGPIQPVQTRHGLIFKFEVGLAGIVVVVSATFATAATSLPGDKLFAVNKLREKIILSLPLSAQTKAQIQTQIVEARFKALDVETSEKSATATSPTTNHRRLETIKESEESLNQAVNAISANQQDFEKTGNQQQAQKFNQTLSHLAQMASTREQTIQTLANQSSDTVERAEITSHLDHFRSARQKAEIQINISQ